MLFKSRREYDMLFVSKCFFYRLINLHRRSLSSNFLFKGGECYFIFRDIIEVDNINLHRYFLLLWLCFGKISAILNYKNILRLGVRYVSFRVVLRFSGKEVYVMLEFLLEKFLPFISGFSLYRNRNVCLFRITDLSLFTGLKLGPGVFFVRVLHPLYIKLLFVDSTYLSYYMSLLKLSYYELEA